MNYSELTAQRERWYRKFYPYKMIYWDDYNYGELERITYILSWRGRERVRVNDCYIMCDTETSKKADGTQNNHVVAWTISIRYRHTNIVTLWGRKPSDLCEAMGFIKLNLPGQMTVFYFHNYSYDHIFTRKFIYRKFGYPERQLNTKPHYPVCFTWPDMQIKDSLILAQRSLEKWAADYDVEHKKAVGKWEYGKVRNQHEQFTPEELEYIEHDTLAGVECLDAMFTALDKNIATAPYTATGIPREGVRKAGKGCRAKDIFDRQALDLPDYLMAEKVYHGGYTHANRHELGWINPAVCYDFASEYPYCILACKMPMERFKKLSNKAPEFILKYMDTYAFMFKLIMIRPRLKSDDVIMPALQVSKCVKQINAVCDNGRILCAEYVEIYLTELDLDIINEQYDHDGALCTEVRAARKGYMPDYIRKYVYQLFEDKTKLKGGDPVLYALAKAKLNSVYGMMVQKCIRDNIMEDFERGIYFSPSDDPGQLYDKFLNSRNNVLCYQWGVWVTAHAMHNLFRLGSCVKGAWLYSDTDSCYADEWDPDALGAFNESIKDSIRAAGFGPVIHNGREYWPGVAELDGTYSEFKTLGAKRYCCRDKETGKLKITVAGVPKVGVKCLNDDINNFRRGTIFSGTVTGKLTHTYLYVDDIYIDKQGNETGDSIDLQPCDYLLDEVSDVDWDRIFNEAIEIQVYEEGINYEKFI